LTFQLVLTFFGLTSDYRVILFNQIHEIVFYGNGGYDWGTIYNMPIWLRNLTYKLISESNNPNTNDQSEDSWVNPSTKQTIKQDNLSKKITPPSYVTKASKN